MTRSTIIESEIVERTADDDPQPVRRGRRRYGMLVAALLVAAGAAGGGLVWRQDSQAAPPPPPPPPQVTVGTPLRQTIAATTGFLGQFSGVDRVELRAQVGGTLAAIDFHDGQIVHKGDSLFVIDPRPFQIRLDQAVARLQTAEARKSLADAELWRAQQLK
jgi:membrane fusion protein, multidrug efflux system